MFVWWGTRSKVRPVPGGRRERMRCPECGETATFRECVAEEALTVFSVVALSEDREVVYRCGECGELFDLVDRADPALPAPAAAREAVAREAATREAAARAEADRRARARADAQRSAAVDAELAALKRKLGRG